MPKVMNLKDFPASSLGQLQLPPGIVRIDRRSPWGNPFRIGEDGSREEVVAKFREYLKHKPQLLKAGRELLRGKDLACWCAPLLCHGDVWLMAVNMEGDDW